MVPEYSKFAETNSGHQTCLTYDSASQTRARQNDSLRAGSPRFKIGVVQLPVPIAVTGNGGTFLAGISAAAHKSDRRAFYLLLAACGFGLVGCLVTVIVNVPINQRLSTWNPAALPPDYEQYLRRWWEWHHVRLVVMFTAVCLVFAAILVRRQPPLIFSKD